MESPASLAISDVSELRQISKELRRKSLEIIYQAGSGHPGGSLSAADLIAAIFFGKMRFDPKKPGDPNRDRFILSKGHCTGLLYSTLAKAGWFDSSKLSDYRKINSELFLSGHPHPKTPGVEIATGSLGQGLSVGNGMALAARLDKLDYKVYVLMGDGELQEGQVWEAAMSSVKYKLTNLTAIIDYNKLAQDSATKDLKDLEPLEDKWKSFGWNTIRIDGHDMEQVLDALNQENHPEKPKVIIADTVKGKGVSFMENETSWHGVAPSDEEYEKALKELA
jgi:transketolase